MNAELQFLDTSNEFAVTAHPTLQSVMIIQSPCGAMTRGEALNLAAWIVALVDPGAKDFNRLLKAILNT